MPGAQWKWVTLQEAMALTGEDAAEDAYGLPDVTALALAERLEPSGPGLPEQDQHQEPTLARPAPSIWRSEEVMQVAFYGFWVVMGVQGTFGAVALLAGSGSEKLLYGPMAALPVVMLGLLLADALRAARRRVNREALSAGA